MELKTGMRMKEMLLFVLVMTVGGTIAVRAEGQQVPPAGRTQRARVPRDVTPQHGTARIRGRVTADGNPVAGARVTAAGIENRDQYSGATDANGRYDIAGIVQGSYRVRVVKEGFLPGVHANGTNFAVANGATLDDIDVVLSRGSAIDGVVLDPAGSPMAGVEVTPLQKQFVRGERRMIPAGTRVRTDDRGEFRLFNLRPGQYYLLATPPNTRQTLGELTSPPGTGGMAPTYYPNTAQPGQATPVTLTETPLSLTLQLSTAPLLRIAGFVLDATGAPLKPGTVAVFCQPTNGTASGALASTSDDGRFTMFRLVPGTYQLRTRTIDPAQPVMTALVTLVDRDVTNVVLRPATRSRITGRIRTTATGAADALRTLRIEVGALLLDSWTNIGGQRPGVMKDDFTFEFESWPGRALVHVTSGTSTWTVKGVRLNGVDLTDSGLEIVSGQPIDGLEIELTDRRSLITGTLITSKNEPMAASRVAIFSTDRERWREPSGRHVVTTESNGEGSFTVSGLPEGDYYVTVIDAETWAQWPDPDTLARLRARATRFTLRDGEQKTLQVRIGLNP
jgi:hypothetical protein